MKKNMKKFASVMLAGMMLSSMAMTAWADTSDSKNPGKITINETIQGKSYELYKIFDLTYSKTDSGTNVSYTIDSDWEGFFSDKGSKYISVSNEDAEGKNLGLNPITVITGENKVTKYINITDDNIEEFSKAAQEYAMGLDNDAIDSSVEAEGATTVVDNLLLGYYLVYPVDASAKKGTYGCLCSLTSTAPEDEVTVKATYPDIEKTDDKSTVAIGETVTYTITGAVPDITGYTDYVYRITDTMSEGLTFNKDVVVKVAIDGEGEETTYKTLTVGSDYTCDVVDDGFTLNIKVKGLQTYIGNEIKVTYTAVVNEKAAGNVEKNSAKLDYTNAPSDMTVKEAEVYSAQIVINKIEDCEEGAEDEAVKLANAVFVLRNSDGHYYKYTEADPDNADTYDKVTWVELDKDADLVVTAEAETITSMKTDDNGAATFPGLVDGTYELVEIIAPDGYNLLDSPVSVEINGSSATVDSESDLTETVDVKNMTGVTLPETGGMGTRIFYALGGGLMVAALALIALKKRENAEE